MRKFEKFTIRKKLLWKARRVAIDLNYIPISFFLALLCLWVNIPHNHQFSHLNCGQVVLYQLLPLIMVSRMGCLRPRLSLRVEVLLGEEGFYKVFMAVLTILRPVSLVNKIYLLHCHFQQVLPFIFSYRTFLTFLKLIILSKSNTIIYISILI